MCSALQLTYMVTLLPTGVRSIAISVYVCLSACSHVLKTICPNHTTTVLLPLFRDHPGEPVPEENFWTLWCKESRGKHTDHRLGATPSGLISAYPLLNPPPSPIFTDRMPSCRPTNSVKALKAIICPNYMQFSVHVTCERDLVLL